MDTHYLVWQAVFQPGQTCVLAKNKAPNFRSLHEAKELVSFTWGGHELLTFRKYGSQPPTCPKVNNDKYVSFSIIFPDDR